MAKDIVILFDLDGTLIDSTDAIVGCFYHSFKELNFDFKGTTKDITKEIGYPLDVMYETLGIQKEKVNDFVNCYKKEYRKVSEEKTFLLPNALETVQLASTFARLGIVTTKTTAYTIPLLKNFGLMCYFETIIGRQEVKYPKPNPEPIFKAMEKLDVKPSMNVYMIGDTKLDMIAGLEANISNIGVLCGYGTKEELSKYTNNIVTNSLDAVKLIQKNYF